ncbi:hypothetical protein [Streptomyces sp. YGL11-2]|uniref:hypothetical protein n=1 Tax=Streptomyces sp. YGL11-2 TaxID=3414028 RepID=UPI003CF1202D
MRRTLRILATTGLLALLTFGLAAPAQAATADTTTGPHAPSLVHGVVSEPREVEVEILIDVTVIEEQGV